MKAKKKQIPTGEATDDEAAPEGLAEMFGSVAERIDAVLHPDDAESRAQAWAGLSEDERQQALARYNLEREAAELAEAEHPDAEASKALPSSDESAPSEWLREASEHPSAPELGTGAAEPTAAELTAAEPTVPESTASVSPTEPPQSVDTPRSLPGVPVAPTSSSLSLPPLSPEPAQVSPQVNSGTADTPPTEHPEPVSDATTVTPTIRPSLLPEGWGAASPTPLNATPPVRLADLVFAQGPRVELVAPKVLLGRNPTSEDPAVQILRLPDTGRAVSRNHALLELLDGRWYITDLRSTNGTRAVMGDRDVLLPAGRQVEVRGAFRIGGYEAAIEQ